MKFLELSFVYSDVTVLIFFDQTHLAKGFDMTTVDKVLHIRRSRRHQFSGFAHSTRQFQDLLLFFFGVLNALKIEIDNGTDMVRKVLVGSRLSNLVRLKVEIPDARQTGEEDFELTFLILVQLSPAAHHLGSRLKLPVEHPANGLLGDGISDYLVHGLLVRKGTALEVIDCQRSAGVACAKDGDLSTDRSKVTWDDVDQGDMCLLIKPHGRIVQIFDLPATAKFALRIVITERIHEAIEETEKTTTSIRIVPDLGLPFVRLAELPDLCSRVQRHAGTPGQFLLQRVHFLGTGTNLISHPVPSLGQTCGRSGRCEHLFLGERLLPHRDQHLVHLFELLFGTHG